MLGMHDHGNASPSGRWTRVKQSPDLVSMNDIRPKVSQHLLQLADQAESDPRLLTDTQDRNIYRPQMARQRSGPFETDDADLLSQL